MTSDTGSGPFIPKVPADRVVVKARMPNEAKSSTTSRVPSTATTLLDARDLRAKGAKSLVDALVSSLDLTNVVDRAGATRAECSEQHGHPGADIRRFHGGPTQRRGPGHQRAVRVAEHDARAHPDELVDEEHPRLEHLLVHQDEALALRGGDDRDRHDVGRERRPRLVLELRHVPAEVASDFLVLIFRDDEILAVFLADDAEPLEAHSDRAEVLEARVLDAQLGARDGREADERSNLDVIGPDRVRSPAYGMTPVNRERIRPDPLDVGAERGEKMRQVLHVGLARRVAKHGGAGGGDSRGQRILGRGDAGLIEKDVGALELLRAQMERVADIVRRTELLEGEEVGIDAAPADDVATRRRQGDLAASREQRSGEEDRRAYLRRERAIDRRGANGVRVELERIRPPPLRLHIERAHEIEKGLDIADAWHVVQGDGLIGNQRRTDDRKGGVLVSRRTDRARERALSLDDELDSGHRVLSW